MKLSLMKCTGNWLLIALLSTPLGLYAHGEDQPKGTPVNTTAVMSDDIIKMRLKALGYETFRVSKTSSLRYEVMAVKAGKIVVLDFHPQLGTVDEVTGQSVSSSSSLLPREFTPETPVSNGK